MTATEKEKGTEKNGEKNGEKKGTAYNASSTAEHQRTHASAEHRGAGSGEYANATRGRNYDQTPTEYAKGSIEKGRIDPEELSTGQTAEMKAARDRRAYLIDQAEKNEAANDELNAIQVEQIKKVQLAQNQLQDPDRMREESMETAINALKSHDPDTMRENADAARKQREKDRKDDRKDKSFGSPTTADFKAGQASG